MLLTSAVLASLAEKRGRDVEPDLPVVQAPDAVAQLAGTSIRRLLGEGKNKILLNLAGVGYIDSSGIGELVSSFTAVNKEGGTLKLLNLTQKIQDLLAITKLLTVFETYDNEADAVRSFSSANV